MERIVKGRSATLTKTFTFTPTGTPTVALTRVSDGTTVATGSVSGATTTWSYTIPASSNTLLDTYTETWTAVTGGASQAFTDYVEVAGEVLFTLADARANTSLASTTTFPDAAIIAMRTTVEDALEHACSRAFVPRYSRETLSGTGTTTLMLSRPDIRSVRSVTVGGTAYSAGDLANVAFSPSGELYTPLGWTCGHSNIVVGYEHGMGSTPPEVSRAAITLAKMWLVGQRNPIDDRAITFNTTEGGTYSLAVPGRNGSTFGQPDIDSVVQRYDMTVGVA